MWPRDSARLNRAWYLWRRSEWMLDPRRFFTDWADVPVQRPIFFLGNQGDGLTFVSRMVRRHPDVVSVTGITATGAARTRSRT